MSSTLSTIGWREWVCLPDLRVDLIKAKVGTGARTSSIHAVNIERFEENGIDRVRADIASSVHVQTKRSVD